MEMKNSRPGKEPREGEAPGVKLASGSGMGKVSEELKKRGKHFQKKGRYQNRYFGFERRLRQIEDRTGECRPTYRSPGDDVKVWETKFVGGVVFDGQVEQEDDGCMSDSSSDCSSRSEVTASQMGVGSMYTGKEIVQFLAEGKSVVMTDYFPDGNKFLRSVII